VAEHELDLTRAHILFFELTGGRVEETPAGGALEVRILLHHNLRGGRALALLAAGARHGVTLILRGQRVGYAGRDQDEEYSNPDDQPGVRPACLHGCNNATLRRSLLLHRLLHRITSQYEQQQDDAHGRHDRAGHAAQGAGR